MSNLNTTQHLYEKLNNVNVNNNTYDYDFCESITDIVDEINELKKKKNAVVLSHSYLHPEILVSVSDYVGDSYELSKRAQEAKSDIIVFAAVRFMAETAKLLNPTKKVLFPNRNGGCSLADAINGEKMRKLKAQFPEHTFVCYINTTADVKAECDVCVTSSNVYKIIEKIPNNKIFFVPDRLMGLNIIDHCIKNNIKKEIQVYDGTCYVHEEYDPDLINYWRKKVDNLYVLAHPECSPEIIRQADYVGSTSGMLQQVKNLNHTNYLMLTECGLISRLQTEISPEKKFIGTCMKCKYMKSNTLKDIKRVLEYPQASDEILIPDDIAQKAVKCINKMFEYA